MVPQSHLPLLEVESEKQPSLYFYGHQNFMDEAAQVILG